MGLQKFDLMQFLAQINLSGPWENVYAPWQHLLLQLIQPNLAYPILTLPNQLNIPFPNPSGGYLALAKPRATLSQPQALILVARLLISKVTKIRRTIYWDHYSWLVPNFLTLQMPNLEIYGSSLTRITLTECEFVHPQTLNPLARLCPNLIHLALENPSTVPDDLFVGEVNLINLHLYLTLFLILS